MMTKNNTGKFFALKLCGLLPALALPVALFGLSTAETASPEIPTVAGVETHTQAADTVSKKSTVKYTTTGVYQACAVDVTPEFPGGQGEMMKFIYANLKYPKEAAGRKVQGRVAIRFMVKADGKISDVVVQKSVDPLLDAEAARVIKAMPAWTPGKHEGKAVAVQLPLPVVFQLSKEKAPEVK
ncbi:MAG: energy transducer TonB [Prevotellaceae bacterium]|nr:energy transducer TonB [Prevotellaceae bacterium]